MDAILGARLRYGEAVPAKRATLRKAAAKPGRIDVVSASDIREDLVRACSAAATPGHPMRHVVLAHFADRVLALAADHERLIAALQAAQKLR